jgi:hypothetical protein
MSIARVVEDAVAALMIVSMAVAVGALVIVIELGPIAIVVFGVVMVLKGLGWIS